MVSQQSQIQRLTAPGHPAPDGASTRGVNVGDTERLCSLAGGGMLAWLGAREGGIIGTGLALLGGGLIFRGLTGHCPMYAVQGINARERHSSHTSIAAGRGFKIVESVAVNASAEELFNIWRDFENLPQFMSHLIRVEDNGRLSHWFAHGPAGLEITWDAEIITEDPGRMIGWRSLPGSQVDTAGSVHFTPLSGGRGTAVQVTFKYDPPGGKLGSWLAWVFGQEPGRRIREDLHRFKELVETGEIAHGEHRSAKRF